MRYSALFMLFLMAVSCNQKNNSKSEVPVAYSQLIAGFEDRFARIEVEYESAGDQRKLELDALYEMVELEMVEAQKQFIRSNPDSLRCISILNEIDWSFNSAAEFRSYLDIIDASLHNHEGYVKLSAIVDQMENVEIGQIAPDFEMTDTDGNSRKLSDEIIGTEYLLLDFWASTCGPCRAENPNIRKAYDRFHSMGFDIFGVSTDTRKELWLEAVAKDSLIWTNTCSLKPWSENEIVRLYGLRQVSLNFLLDSSGKILATNLRGEELQEMLFKLMN